MEHRNGFVYLADEEAAEVKTSLALMRKHLLEVYSPHVQQSYSIDHRMQTIDSILYQLDQYDYPAVFIGAGPNITISLDEGEIEFSG